MKQTIITTMAILVGFLSFGQSNNPFNQKGIDYATSYRIISDDFNAGTVREFNQEALNYYSGIIPIRPETTPTMEMTSSIIRTIKAPGFNLKNLIEGSDLSPFSKAAVSNIYNAQNSATAAENLVSITEGINKNEKISAAEKEYLLSLAAISYNMSVIYGNTTDGRWNWGGMAHGIVGGYVIGSYWGPVGGLIGALICGVAGGLS